MYTHLSRRAVKFAVPTTSRTRTSVIYKTPVVRQGRKYPPPMRAIAVRTVINSFFASRATRHPAVTVFAAKSHALNDFRVVPRSEMQLPRNVRGHQIKGTRLRLGLGHIQQRMRTPPAVVRAKRTGAQFDHTVLRRL